MAALAFAETPFSSITALMADAMPKAADIELAGKQKSEPPPWRLSCAAAWLP